MGTMIFFIEVVNHRRQTNIVCIDVRIDFTQTLARSRVTCEKEVRQTADWPAAQRYNFASACIEQGLHR